MPSDCLISLMRTFKETHEAILLCLTLKWQVQYILLFQPLTELEDNKCKRCGLYESDRLKSDDVFDEWELCPDDFFTGISIHYKRKEFNATLECDECKTTKGKNPAS